MSARLARRTVRGTLWLALPLMLVAALTDATAAPADKRVVVNFLISVVLVLGIQVFSGNSGIISFGHIAFMGIGAYVAALITIAPDDKQLSVPHLWGWLAGIHLSFVPAVVVSGALTGAVALVVGGGLVRMRENAMAMATFAILVIFSVVFASWNQVTGGAAGIYGIPSRVTIWIAFAFVVLAVLAARGYRESRVGLKLRASREDALAAAALGAGVERLRLGAWVLSASLMGVGGAVWAQYNLAFGPQQFTFTQTFNLLAMLVVGGLANVSGAVVGTAAITLVTEILRRVEDATHIEGLTEIVVALTILVVLRARPAGLVAWNEIDDAFAHSRLARRLRRARGQLRRRAAAPAREHVAFASRLVEIPGATLEVWEAGEGPVVSVYAHAYADAQGPAPAGGFGDALARGGRALVVAPRGTGRSSPASGRTLGMSQLADDLEALRVALGVERWVVAGWSIGGMAALVYALRHPQATRALVLSGTAASWRFYEDPASLYNPAHPDAWREEEARRNLDGSEAATGEWVRTVLALSLHDRSVLDELTASTRIAPERLVAVRDEVLGDPPWDVEAELDALDVPALVVTGRHDTQVPPRWSEALAERLPRGEPAVFEGSGHFPFEEEPERFAQLVGEFLARVASTTETTGGIRA